MTRLIRSITALVAATAGSMVITTVAEAGAVTTRIEPRPYYGAVVTVEQGVRVWRPLPPTDRVIINPGNRASISFNIDATRHQSYGGGGAPVVLYGGGEGGPVYGHGGYGGGYFFGRGHKRVTGYYPGYTNPPQPTAARGLLMRPPMYRPKHH
jgi:hypothetical protein